jgi:2',3'-cyclic-nucleotide 2'-phosphodiesterase (5'-nucleotidase family)
MKEPPPWLDGGVVATTVAVRVKAMRVLAALILATSAMAGVGASCGDSDGTTTPTNPPPVERPDPTFRLMVITDIKGYLAPCGCNTRPLGGIDRMAAEVAEVRHRGEPALLVAAGDLFFGNEEHGFDGDGAETQNIWSAELLIDVFDRMDMAAATPGHLDFAHGVDTFRQLAAEAEFPFLAAGVRIGSGDEGGDENGSEDGDGSEDGNGRGGGGENLLRPTLLREIAGVKLGLVGVSRFESRTGAVPEGVTRETELAEAARAGVASLKEEGAELIVALVSGTRRDARQIARLDDVDFVVQAGLDQAEAIPPVDADGSFLVHGGRHGQGLLVLDIWRRDDGDFTDWSEWTVADEREHLEARIGELRRRLEEWAGDDSVDEADVANQRRRLERMERELAALRPPSEVEGNAFFAEWVELPPDAPQLPAITRLLDALDRRINDNNARVFADLVPEPAPEGTPHYVGSESCAGSDCHQAAYDWWTGHAHGRAYATLVERHKEFNLSCVGCHVTGYMKPGGSTVTHNADGALVNVGCEVCHGPGSAHVADPEADGLITLETPERVCVNCHNPEHSERFVYDAFINMILVPGHGRPAPSGS